MYAIMDWSWFTLFELVSFMRTVLRSSYNLLNEM